MVNFTILALYLLEAPLGANCMIISCLTALLFTLPVLLLCMIQCNTVPLQVKKISTNLFTKCAHAYINRMQTTYRGYQKRFIEFSFILQNENLIVLCAWFGFYLLPLLYGSHSLQVWMYNSAFHLTHAQRSSRSFFSFVSDWWRGDWKVTRYWGNRQASGVLLCQEDQTHDCMLMVPTSSDMGWHATHVRHILCAMRMLSSILLFMDLVIYSNYILHKCGYYNFPHRKCATGVTGKRGTNHMQVAQCLHCSCYLILYWLLYPLPLHPCRYADHILQKSQIYLEDTTTSAFK